MWKQKNSSWIFGLLKNVMTCFSSLTLFSFCVVLALWSIQEEIRFNVRINNFFCMLNHAFLWKIKKILHHLYFWISPHSVTFKFSFLEICDRNRKRKAKYCFSPELIIPFANCVLIHHSICHHNYWFFK